MEVNDLLEPEMLYKTQLKEKHNENVEKFFDNLEKRSGVNKEENKITCNKYYKALADLSKMQKKLGGAHGLLALFIIMLVLGAVALILGIIFAANGGTFGWFFIAGGALFVVGGILLIVLVYAPKANRIKVKIAELEDLIARLKAEAYAQMAPLNRLFDESIPARIFHQTCPLIEMDRIFDVKKYEMMREKYGLWDNSDENTSTLNIQSGSILGNPFVIFKDMFMTMVNHTYTGSKTITYSVGSGNNRRFVTETLRASVTKPKATYSTATYLLYGNDAANNLSFSREPSNINSFDSEKAIDKYVIKHEKNLTKLAEKAMKKGGNYTPLGNSEFELFFGGLDRDNEVEYRLLFTPLAQKSMLGLMKSKTGYGDDFRFKKIKGLNYIESRHSQGTTLFVNTDDFIGFDFEVVRNYFIAFNNAYFKALFFDFAPLLSIPLYQQHKAREYIYKDTKKYNFNPFMHEVISNHFDVSVFAHKNTCTETILKTNLTKTVGDTDLVSVTGHSFETVRRIEYVSVRGGDGYWHDVPVEWIEYIPLEQTSLIEIGDTEVDDAPKFKSLNKNNVIYARGLVSRMGDATNVNIDELKSLMKKD